MASIRQRHTSVPSSNSPAIPEWADHFWYVLRVAALQANDKLTEAEAALLVVSYESYKITLPCPTCRQHYAEYWATSPFTTAEAQSALAAMKWVEDLRIHIEARKKAEAPVAVARPRGLAVAAVVAPPPVPKVAAGVRTYASQAMAARATAQLRQGSVGTPGFVTPTASSVQTAQAAAFARAAAVPRSGGGEAMQRQVAIQSALQQTRANQAGPRGCNCGKRR